jgi:hypothetical protein
MAGGGWWLCSRATAVLLAAAAAGRWLLASKANFQIPNAVLPLFL